MPKAWLTGGPRLLKLGSGSSAGERHAPDSSQDWLVTGSNDSGGVGVGSVRRLRTRRGRVEGSGSCAESPSKRGMDGSVSGRSPDVELCRIASMTSAALRPLDRSCGGAGSEGASLSWLLVMRAMMASAASDSSPRRRGRRRAGRDQGRASSSESTGGGSGRWRSCDGRVASPGSSASDGASSASTGAGTDGASGSDRRRRVLRAHGLARASTSSFSSTVTAGEVVSLSMRASSSRLMPRVLPVSRGEPLRRPIEVIWPMTSIRLGPVASLLDRARRTPSRKA